jgi:hypothetical protein
MVLVIGAARDVNLRIFYISKELPRVLACIGGIFMPMNWLGRVRCA